MDLEKKYRDNIKKELDEICGTKKVVIWGAGSYGYNMFQTFKKYKFENHIVAFCDNCETKWNTTIENLEVLNYRQIKEKYKDDVVFLICSDWKGEIEEQLTKLGEKDNICIPSIQLMASYTVVFMQNTWEKSNKEEFDRLIYNTSELLDDDESKRVLFARADFIKTTDWRCIESININKPQYFLNDFYELSDKEIYIDLGAYIGDTVFRFIDKVGGKDKYKKIIAFEPDKKTYKTLEDNIKKNNLKNVDIYNLGSWNRKDILSFTSGSNANINASAHIVKSKESEIFNEIHVEALDNLFIDVPITFIKMDIEGAEKESLFGAKKIIQKYKPKLAICVYHKWEDIYEIPKIIKSFVPEYKIYLRHHSKNLSETVCYACL